MNLNWTSGTAVHMLKMLELGGYQYRVNGMKYADNSNLFEHSSDDEEAINAGYRIAENESIAFNASNGVLPKETKPHEVMDIELASKALRHGLQVIDDMQEDGEDPVSILDIYVSDHTYAYENGDELNVGDVIFVHDAGFLSAEYRAGNVYKDLKK